MSEWNPLDVSWLGPLDPTSWFKQEMPEPEGASPSVPLRVHPEHGRGKVAIPTENHSAPQLRQGLEHRMSGQGVPVHRDARASESPVRGARTSESPVRGTRTSESPVRGTSPTRHTQQHQHHDHQHGHNRHSHHNHGRPDVEGTLKELTFEAHDMHWRKSATDTSSCVSVADAVLRGGAENGLKQNIRVTQMQHAYEVSVSVSCFHLSVTTTCAYISAAMTTARM